MRRIWLAALFTIVRFPCYAQFLPDLQAKTPEEYDAYLDVMDGPVLAKGAAFERSFPDSALRLPVCELMTRDFRARGDVKEATAAAKRGLDIAPDYVPLLVELADLLASGSDSLDRASETALRALELLERVKAPRRVSPEQWTETVAGLRAKAHGALGMVRFKKDDVAGAVKEFESAMREPVTHDPSLHYRLGRLYALTGRKEEARRELQEAARRGENLLRERAKEALAELR